MSQGRREGTVEPRQSFHRQLLARAYGERYKALATLADAKACEDGVVILDGGNASQIYLVCPAMAVQCDEIALTRLLLELDSIAWCGGEPSKAAIYYEQHPVSSMIYGGAGGGRVMDELWVHTQFERAGLAGQIREVLAGTRPGL